MSPWDALGYLASGLVLLAFCMKSIIPLRVVAITSNIAFLAYGLGMDLEPVWLLHAALLPINAWRLWAAACRRTVLAKGSGAQTSDLIRSLDPADGSITEWE